MQDSSLQVLLPIDQEADPEGLLHVQFGQLVLAHGQQQARVLLQTHGVQHERVSIVLNVIARHCGGGDGGRFFIGGQEVKFFSL